MPHITTGSRHQEEVIWNIFLERKATEVTGCVVWMLGMVLIAI